VQELMRYTPKNHPDFQNLEKAYNCMEKLVLVVNENSRESKNVKEIRDIESALTGASVWS
jgi:hypothetical protein